MAKGFEITCPHCSRAFSGEDLLKDHIAEADEKFKKKEQLILLEAKKKAEAEANKRIKESEKSIQSLTSANKILKDREVQASKKMKERETELLIQATKKAEAEANKKMQEVKNSANTIKSVFEEKTTEIINFLRKKSK